jgi:xanthosine utilization system XapX-like protein
MCPNTTKYNSITWITQYLINSRILTPPDIQNKIIEISGEMVGEKVVRVCNDFVYFGLIGDEATDVSTYEQVSVCVRFVECTGGKVIRRENFSALCKQNYR